MQAVYQVILPFRLHPSLKATKTRSLDSCSCPCRPDEAQPPPLAVVFGIALFLFRPSILASGTSKTGVSGARKTAGPGQRILILWGSQTGTAERFSKELAMEVCSGILIAAMTFACCKSPGFGQSGMIPDLLSKHIMTAMMPPFRRRYPRKWILSSLWRWTPRATTLRPC